ncbi:MAG: transcriptional regulator, LysR family [Rhizobacter sp.]|nr:transcriptional regulator, LysR family [Rhizobacter sp.]
MPSAKAASKTPAAESRHRSSPAAKSGDAPSSPRPVNLHRLDLVSLSLFALVVRTGSISKGAELANLAVGAASKRISDLESALGVELFERHSRGVTLTVAGRALQRHSQRILTDVDHLAADLSDYAAGIVGVVRLWANTSAVTQFLPLDVAGFVAANPGIRIELEEQNSSEIVLAVLDGRADIGIFADRTPPLGLQTVTYRHDRLVLVTPKSHPLSARKSIQFIEAADLEFVSLSGGTSLAQRLNLEALALGKRLRLRIQVRSFDAMCQMVAAGLGVAVLPDAAVQPHLRSMGLRKIDIRDDWVHRKLLIGARDFAALARPVRLFMDHLLDVPAPARKARTP